MKKLILILLILPVVTATNAQSKRAKAKADKIITANLQSHINYLASDKLEGRRAGSAGENLAMQYISNMFEKYKLAPKGDNGFIQAFEISEGNSFNSPDNHFSVNGEQLEAKTDYYPLSISASAGAKGSVSPMLREQDQIWFWNVSDVLEDNKDNPHFDISSLLKEEAETDAKKGATALIVYNSSTQADNILFNKFDTTAAVTIPVIYITQQGLQKHFADLTGIYDIDLNVHLQADNRKAHNVIGYINFNAPTTVVIGAHYDHLGYGEDGNSLDGAGQIHNGADDNASGTAAMLELARILYNTKARNNNYLFMAFSGEELGLLGSKYWLQHPTANVNLNYMINLDMVGRYAADRKLTIGGYGTSPTWGEIFQTTTDPNLEIKFDSSGSGPSDHSAFYRDSVPVLFFFTNSHPDYHKATDDADKINYKDETEIVDYIVNIINAANDKGKLSFLKTKDAEMRSVSLPVTLGVMPDYGYTGAGMRIDGVSKGKTAEKIGLKPGDVLLQLGDFKFVDVQTYMQALQHFKKGDKTTLIISRDGEEMSFDVQF
ncbi:M28 family peptidase [Parafilimonas terrae]|uniref:Zn-dependent amino-or carboxypeptidase, M28 family n=1 Tax=Parafilimonas terrae TaxID=1465490 RepID=A0A1I5Y9F4_9BACT|nr:M28 family peptidase [Parafilimonas terrae]SFQ40836.1 Zn-dependent amino-or carboxypeptidase, M28 family [Parafilimonas terrae]